MKRFVFALTLAFGFSALAVDGETWRDAKLGYRQKFTFTAATASCPQFPLAIVGNATYFKIDKGRMKTGCWAIFDQDGNQWYGEEVSLSDDGAYHTFEFHASLSTFDLYTAKTALWLYYDPANAPTSSQVGATGSANGKAVWDSSFKGVWHLTNLTESTGNTGDLTAVNTPTTATGIIGGAYAFDSTKNQSLYVSKAAVTASPVTFEGWFNGDTAGDRLIVQVGQDGAGEIWQVVFDGTPQVYGGIFAGGVYRKAVKIVALASAWHHAAAVFTSTTSRTAYLDGSAGTTATDTIADPAKADKSIIGNDPWWTGYRMNGSLDEIRISDAVRSVDWITSVVANGPAGNGLTPDGSGEQTMPAGGYHGYPWPLLNPMKGGHQ